MKVFFLYFVFFLMGCNFDDNHERMSDRIMSEFVKEMKKEKSFEIYMLGGGMKDTVNIVTVGFRVKQKLNQNDARKLAVECASRLLEKYNSNEKIRPFLKNYPFNANNIEISFVFEKGNKDECVEPNYIAATYVSYGKIRYWCFNPNTKQYFDKKEETFEEAVRIVGIQHGDLRYLQNDPNARFY